MRTVLLPLVTCLIWGSSWGPDWALARATVVTTEDGVRVQLNDDGTWARLADDRFATLPDGQRVRLRPDGTWAPISEVPTLADRKMTGSNISAAAVEPGSDVTLLLQKVEIINEPVAAAL